MLNKVCVVLFLCLLYTSIQAQPSPYLNVIEKVSSDSNPNLVLLRTTGLQGSAIALKTFVGDQPMSKLRNRRFVEQQLNPGSYTLKYQWYGKKAKKKARAISVNLKPDETTYILFFLESRFFTTKVHAVQITADTATRFLQDLKKGVM